MNFARSLSSSCLIRPVSALILVGPAAAISQAQAPVVGLDVQDAQNGLALLSAGKYTEAAALYEGIPNKYPTSVMIPEANFRLGYIHYVTGAYDKAVTSLQKNITGKNVPPDILELSYSFVPQILAAKAAKLPDKDPAQKSAYLAAIKEFDTFLQKFPQSEEVESANYGKARAFYAIQQFDDAAGALRTNLQKFPTSPSAPDTQFMLALVLGTQAGLKMQANPTDLAPLAIYDEANKLLGEIIGKRADLALSNDAQFQLGEMLAARGGFEAKEAKDATLTRAITAYRAVQAKELVLKAQADRLAYIQQKKTEALRNNDPGMFKKLQRFLEKEQEKTATIEQRPDQTLTAKLKCAQLYLSLEKFNEARVLLQFLEPQIEAPEQKKEVAYFLVVTYAAQNLTGKAVEGYEKFMAAYPADAIAENLPLLVGLAFHSHQDSTNAIKYYTEQARLYPKSPFTADAVMRQALALIPLEKYDEALEVLKKFLAGSPNKDQAAAAELGMATIYQKTGKGEDALKAFTMVRDKYKGSPEAEQAGYWVGQMSLAKDPKLAITEIKNFIATYPNSEMLPAGMLVLGQAQVAVPDKAAAIKTFEELAAKFAKTEPGAISYFQRAGIFQKDNELEKVKGVMKEFIAAYPENERLFAAYDYIAQIQATEKAPKEAIATYQEFVDKHGADADAAKALLKQSALWAKFGEAMGGFINLNPEQRKEWTEAIDNSLSIAEKVIEKFPDSEEVAAAMQSLLSGQQLKVRFKIKTDKELQDYFQTLAEKFAGKPATKNKILFTLAGYLSQKNDNKAYVEKKVLELMDAAFDEQLTYSAKDLDTYGLALINSKQLDKAQKVYDKLAKDYPLPASVPKDKAPRAIAEAQAMALFGSGRILQSQGKTAEAATKFADLKVSFPFSPKLLEADYGIAEGLVKEKKYDEALKLLGPVTKSTQVSTNVRAKGMMLVGQIEEDRGNLDTAINNYIKLGTLFPAETELAPEGFWRGAQLIEKKLAK